MTAACLNPAEPCHEQARIVAHAEIAANTWRIRLECPSIAAGARPGQFAMLRIPDRHDPLLARPLAIYDVVAPSHAGKPVQADFIYLRHGKFTTALTGLRPGDALAIWGPLGNGFDPPPVDRLVLVAGGIGQTALLALAGERSGRRRYGPPGRVVPTARSVTFLWGARSADCFGDVDDFRAAGCDVHLATLDGSAGRRGTVVDLMDDVLDDVAGSLHVACCGPEPMMAATARWCRERGVGCSVSLEEPMACGVGICFTCVARVREPSGGWDYRRTCVEGPVFPAESIVWAGQDA
jgi:dihydroorotate dehydrogenase electron transfer subunit